MKIDDVGLEEKCREQRQEASVKSEYNRYGYEAILDQESGHGARYRHVQLMSLINKVSYEAWLLEGHT